MIILQLDSVVSARTREMISVTPLHRTAEHALKAAIVSNETIDLFQPQYLDSSYLLELLATTPAAYDALLLADTRFVLPAKDYELFGKAIELCSDEGGLDRAAWWIGLSLADKLKPGRFIVKDQEVEANQWATSAWLVHPRHFPELLSRFAAERMSGSGIDVQGALAIEPECMGSSADIRRLMGLWRLGRLMLERKLKHAAPSLKRLKCDDPPAWHAGKVLQAGDPGMALAERIHRHAGELKNSTSIPAEHRAFALEVSETLVGIGQTLLPESRNTRTAWMRAASQHGSRRAAYCAAALVNAQYHRVLQHSGRCDRIWTTESMAESGNAAATMIDVVERFNETDLGNAPTGLRIEHSPEGRGLDHVEWEHLVAWLRQPTSTDYWRGARNLRRSLSGMPSQQRDLRRREVLLSACDELAIAANPYEDMTGLGVRITGHMDDFKEAVLPVAEPLFRAIQMPALAEVMGDVSTDLDALDASHSVVDLVFEGTKYVFRAVINAAPRLAGNRARLKLRGAIFESVEAIGPAAL